MPHYLRILWLIFHWGIQYFYILFLPIVWMAVRGGLTSVTVGLVLIQFGFIMAIHQSGSLQGDVSGIEARLLVLTLTGFVAGALESERRRAEFQFRQQQSYFAHRSRINSLADWLEHWLTRSTSRLRQQEPMLEL